MNENMGMIGNVNGSWDGGANGGGGSFEGYDAYGYNAGQPGAYHNVWATMTCSWAEEF